MYHSTSNPYILPVVNYYIILRELLQLYSSKYRIDKT